MANRFSKAEKEVLDIVQEIVKNYHSELDASGITFDILMGYAPTNDEGQRTGPALKSGGYAVNGISNITPLKERVKGCSDVEIILDGDIWPGLTEGQKKAIIDHQCQQFVLRRNVDGAPIKDEHSRFKLSKREFDRHFEGFDAIASRHGEDSIEVTQMERIVMETKDLYFPFFEEQPKIADSKP